VQFFFRVAHGGRDEWSYSLVVVERAGTLATVDVLIPTYGRKTGLAMVLTSLLGQTFTDFDVIVSDQTDEQDAYLDSLEIQNAVDALRYHGHAVQLHRHLPRRGMAEQRNFLLDQSRAPYVHYLDNDVILEPRVMERMLSVIRSEQCGFVGAAAAGLTYLDDVRPHQQDIEVWEGPVRPEPSFTPGNIPQRHGIQMAANALHVEQRLAPNGETVRYKVDWIGGANVLYDRTKLLDVGGFSFWDRLPEEHAGEDAVTQFLLIHAHGGCGVLPTGTYHLCMETTIPNREYNATELFGELLEEWKVRTEKQAMVAP
jgi:glycosyltransferase involved in cell wall biosynthesis